MKSYNHLFEKMLDKEFIKQNIIDAAKHKTRRTDVRHVLKHIDYYVDYLYGIIENESFSPQYIKPVKIHEQTCNKERIILRPPFMPDLIVQHMIVKLLQPIFTKHYYPHSCASIPNKGPNYGRKIIKHFICKNKHKRMYVYKFDIRKFFEHIDRRILMTMLSNKIHDYRFLKIIHMIIFYDNEEIGIPLGFYSSQWFANWYLTYFDYMLKQFFHVPFVMRYMDDIVLIDFNKNHLRNIIYKIHDVLLYDYGLLVKRNHQLFLFDDGNRHGRCIDYMGFKFYRNRTTLRKRTLYKIRRKANHIHRKYYLCNKHPGWYVSTQMLSRFGSLSHVDCTRYFVKYIKDKIHLKAMRDTMSRHSKYLNSLLQQPRKEVSIV